MTTGEGEWYYEPPSLLAWLGSDTLPPDGRGQIDDVLLTKEQIDAEEKFRKKHRGRLGFNP